MPRLYSRKNLAELIAQGHDTASAATLFGRRLEFIEAEQRTPDYARFLQSALTQQEQGIQNIARVASSDATADVDASANFIREITVEVNTLVEIRFTYKIGTDPATGWGIDVFETFLDLQTDTDKVTMGLPTFTFSPTDPATSEGTHVGQLSFTPTTTGKLFIKFYVNAANADFVVVEVTVNDASGNRPFDFASEDNFTVVEGGAAAVDTVEWTQGIPVIPNFVLSDVGINFYRDAAGTDRILPTDSDFVIDGDPLDHIVTLENFVDNMDGTGTFDCRVDPSGINTMLFMRERIVYIRYFITQPDPP